MANVFNIINAFLPNYAVDTVAVYDQNFNQIFPQARSIRARIREEARVMEHPLETGAIITDHRIIMPVEIELSMILASEDYPSVYHQIRGFYLNSTLLIVQTKVGIYENQLIAAMPHEEDPSLFDALTLGLSLKQTLLVSPEFNIVPMNPSNSNTTDRGAVQGTAVSKNINNIVTNSIQQAGNI